MVFILVTAGVEEHLLRNSPKELGTMLGLHSTVVGIALPASAIADSFGILLDQHHLYLVVLCH